MTKEQFKQYVLDFKKQPGEYTEDELISIGIEHQALLRVEKDWTALANELGVNKSGEQFRKWILSKRYNRGLVPKNPKVLDDSTVESVTTDEVADSLSKQKEELFIERTKLRDTYNAYRRGMREEARIDSFKEYLVESMKVLPTLPKVEPVSSKKKSNVEMVLGYADLHLGIEFENSYNSYNYDIAVQRVSKLVSQVVKYCHLHNVQRLTFLNIGDLISGIIHPTLRLEQGLNVADQAMRAAELTAEALNQLQAAAPEVIYRSVVDNHSRLSASKEEHIELESFNRIIDWFIEERLKGTKIKFPKDNLDAGIGMFKLLNGKNMIFMHGHQDKKSTIFQDMVGLIKEYPDYIFMGHYHNSAEHTFQGAKVFVAGSIVGTDTYAYGRRLFGSPEQKAIIFSDDDVLDINIRLN